jgi:hypothetical protein
VRTLMIYETNTNTFKKGRQLLPLDDPTLNNIIKQTLIPFKKSLAPRKRKALT